MLVRCEMTKPYPSNDGCGFPTTKGWRPGSEYDKPSKLIPCCDECADRHKMLNRLVDLETGQLPTTEQSNV